MPGSGTLVPPDEVAPPEEVFPPVEVFPPDEVFPPVEVCPPELVVVPPELLVPWHFLPHLQMGLCPQVACAGAEKLRARPAASEAVKTVLRIISRSPCCAQMVYAGFRKLHAN